MGKILVSTTGLAKSFGTKSALNEVNLSIRSGEIVGLIGPNGSGKTTLLNVLLGVLQPSSGTFSLFPGLSVGMSVSRKGFLDDMSVRNNLLLYSGLLGLEAGRVDQWLAELSIDFGQLQFGSLSAGMKQKVSLVMSFISDNPLILLDEPTNHLDVDSILNLRRIVNRLGQSGVSFLITSHILSDLEKVCTRIVFLKDGVICGDFSTAALLGLYPDLEAAYKDVVWGL